MKEKLLIFGDTQYASLVSSYFIDESEFNFEAFFVDDAHYKRSNLDGHPVLQLTEVERLYRPGTLRIFMAVGYRSIRTRRDLYSRLLKSGYRFTNYISDKAYVDKSVKVGLNNIVMPGVVIERNVAIENNNVIWSNATVCHDSLIGSHNFIAANTTIGGNVSIKSCSFFGFSSVVLQDVTVGEETLLAAMSLLDKDSVDCGKYVGVPGRLVESHDEHGVCV